MSFNLFSRFGASFRRGVQRSISVNDSGIQDQIEAVIGQGKLFLGTFSDLHAFLRAGTVASVQANLCTVNRGENHCVIGAFSRAIVTPSVSGPSFQACGYQIDRLQPDPSQVMTVYGSKSAFPNFSVANFTSRRVQRHDVAAYHTFTSSYGRRRILDNCTKASIMSLRNKEQPNNLLLYGYFIYNVAKRKGSLNPFLGFAFEGFHISSPACSSAGTAPDVSFENLTREEIHSSAADTSDMNVPKDRVLKLNSGSCYLPHPDKEETGGDDAHFICTDEQAIGVADGVGGWADVGIDAGEYARELMSNSVTAIRDEPRRSVDPSRVLEKAYTITKAKGSSTACIISLTDQGLHAINLGDSGFMVVRNGCTVFRSPAQQHDFNYTYQLESGNAGDLPSSGQVFTVAVAPGDVVIAGTDGLFDNLYNNDITAVVVHAMRAGLGPQVTAQKIAALARQRAQDKNRQTPFSTAAQEAGYRYYGGKLDDITVVVSYITSEQNEKLSATTSS